MSLFKPVARQFAKFVPEALVRPLTRPAVVYFHGVEAEGSDAEIERIHHRADLFAEIVTALNKTYTILPMRALGEVLRQPHLYRNCLFITFDDGYANNLLAAQILQALAIPWTLFVSTDHIEKGEPDPIFMARLFFMYAGAGSYSLPYFRFHVRLGAWRQRRRMMDRGIAELKNLDAARAEECLMEMKARLGSAKLLDLIDSVRSKKFLTWDQVRSLRDQGAEIGSHACVHWPMHRDQSDAYLKEQAAISKSQIEANVGTCKYFAYPFGQRADCSVPAWRAVRDSGYDYAFTAIPGTLDASRNDWLLPRYGIGIHERAVTSIIPMLRANNRVFRRWQDRSIA